MNPKIFTTIAKDRNLCKKFEGLYLAASVISHFFVSEIDLLVSSVGTITERENRAR